MEQQSSAGHGLGATISGLAGLGLYLLMGFFYLSSGLVVPPPWLWLLWAIWIAGLYPLVTVFRRRRVWTPVVAVVAAVVWWFYLAAGGTFFNWTA